MKTLFYECFAGISGDMNLGAMVDLGVDVAHLKAELHKLGLDHEFKLEVKKEDKHGIYGIKINVVDLNAQRGCHHAHHHSDGHHHGEDAHHHSHGHHHGEDAHHHSHEHHHGEDAHYHSHEHHHGEDAHHHSHEHHHGEDAHHHTHEHHHTHGHHQGHSHENLRNFSDIKKIIEQSTLSSRIKKDSIGIFEIIAHAEGKMHNKPMEEVHFHEVGAIDSIVDIVGAAICMAHLNIDKVYTTDIEVGSGFVQCAHGLMPVPAPATAEILTGLVQRSDIKGHEMTTPTGAAILKYYNKGVVKPHRVKTLKIGYGLGSRNLEIPNLLRVSLIEDVADEHKNRQFIIETNIDDMSSEKLVYAESLLLKAGARDVFKTPIIMKKGRPAIKLSILSEEAHIDTMLEIIYTHTSSIGVRTYQIAKHELNRTYQNVVTPYGDIPVKLASYKGKIINTKPEYEACKTVASAHGITLNALDNIIEKQLNRQKNNI